MSTINEGLSTAIDGAFPPRGQQRNMSPFDTWLTTLGAMIDQRGSERRGGTSIEVEILCELRSAVIKSFLLRAGGGPSTFAFVMLSSWMRARELTENLEKTPFQSDVLDALYELAGLIESMEEQPGWPYLTNLRRDLTNQIALWQDSLDWFISAGFDPAEIVYEEIDELYETRDRLEWTLSCLTFFKFEFSGRLQNFDVEYYRSLLLQSEDKFRKVVAKARRDGWHQPDPSAPKSFWWREPVAQRRM